MYTQQEIASMTAAEQEMARSMNAAEEAGEDPFKDDDVDSEGGATDEAAEIPGDNTEAAAEEPAAVEEEPSATDEPAAAAAEEPAAAAEEPAVEEPADPPPTLRGEAPADLNEQIKALRIKRAEVRKQWSSGEIDDDQLDALEGPIEDQIYALREQATVARTLETANAQFAHQQAMSHIETIRQAGLKAGLKYEVSEDGKTIGEDVQQFNRQLNALTSDPTWAAKSFASRANEAHRITALLAGKTAAPARTATAQITVPATSKVGKPTAAAPATLRDVPSASRANEGESDLESQWKSASGPLADKLWARLTPAQQERLLDDDAK